MPFMTNSSIRVPHSDRYVPKHSVHDTSRYITIEDGSDDAGAGDTGKVDYMDISDVTADKPSDATGGSVSADAGDGGQAQVDGEMAPESVPQPVTDASDATADATQGTHDDGAQQGVPQGGADGAQGADDVASLSARLDKALAAKQAAEAQRDQAFRDLSNYKRRMEDERERARTDAVSDVGRAVMPAIDDLERVIDHYASQDDPSLVAVASGCDGIRRKLLASLSSLGIEQIDPTGSAFDPDTSMAIIHEDHEGCEPNVVFVTYQKGYRIGDKVIRTAKVGVAK